MRCFVAMAFEHEDTDRLYDEVIEPSLRGMGVEARRVDRIEHNGEIDDRIIREIRESDVVIADLTYARPSVYYEAGYAQSLHGRVIYTCRGDHLGAASDSTNRVHFDLAMKNIISWREPSAAVRKRLAARLRHVLAPLLRQREIDSQKRELEAEFLSLPLTQQLDQLARASLKALGERGFQMETRNQVIRRAEDYWFPAWEGTTPQWFGQKRHLGKLVGVRLLVAESLTKRDLESVGRSVTALVPYDLAGRYVQSEDREFEDHIFLLTLRPLPSDRFRSAIPRAHTDSTNEYRDGIAYFARPAEWSSGFRTHLFHAPAGRNDGQWNRFRAIGARGKDRELVPPGERVAWNAETYTSSQDLVWRIAYHVGASLRTAMQASALIKSSLPAK